MLSSRTMRVSLFSGIVKKSSLNRQLCMSLRYSTCVESSPENSLQSSPIELESKAYTDVGVTEFVGCRPKVSAVIKERPADFQVHEISLNGRKVQLSELNYSPDSFKDKQYKKQKYIHCTLYKEGIEQAEAVKFLSEKLRVPVESIVCAGRKDKISQASQQVSFPSYANGQALRESKDWKRIKLGNFATSFALGELTYGQLRGNHFRILFRDTQIIGHDDGPPSSNLNEISASLGDSMKKLSEVGFVNYFGLQRFGFRNHLAGKAIYQENYKELFNHMLTPRRGDRPFIIEAKMKWQERQDPFQALKCIPIGERAKGDPVVKLIMSLSKYYDGGEGNIRKTYRQIPKPLRRAYRTSFSNYIWNYMVSHRIQQFGLNVVPGDYVYTTPPLFHDGTLLSSNPHVHLSWDTPYVDTFSITSANMKAAKVLTDEDFSNGVADKYSIYDVLLPVFGSTLSRHQDPHMDEFCSQLLVDLGMNPDCFSSLTSESTDVEKGFCRPIVVKPQNVDYKVIPYGDSDNLNKLMPSDVDVLKQEGKLTVKKGFDAVLQETFNPSPPPPPSSSPKDKVAAIIEFALPSSTYATIALRELTQTANYKSFEIMGEIEPL